jgi:hypothetical protein
MKRIFILCFTASILFGQRFPVTIFQELGPRSRQINVVFLAEGYRESEMAKFRTDVQAATTALFNISPYKEYKSFFNVYGVEVVSNQSGTNHPKSASDCPTNSEIFEADTYFNSTFDRANIHRLLVITSSGKANSVLRNTVPNWDIGFVIVNHTMYGGSGGTWAVFSTNSSAPQIAIHEAGHAFANLADEYDYGSGGHEAPNATAITNRTSIKWNNWIKESTPIPTPETNVYNDVVGLFEGAVYETNDWYRPKLNCMMKSLGHGFCEVCTEQTILTIYDLVAPYNYYYPQSGALEISHSYQGLFEVDGRQLSPNTINLNWYLDSTLVAENVANYTVRGAELSEGAHALIVRVTDSTAMVRSDPNNNRTGQVVWELNVGPSLSIDGNSTVPNQIELHPNYPNPFNPSTRLSFSLPEITPATLLVLDINGRVIDTLLNGTIHAGTHTIYWNAKDKAAGVYFFQLETPYGIQTQKGILLK